jgi:damage-control phosphatase, subfamily I
MNASADRDDFPRRLERLLRLDFQRDIPGMAKEALAAIEARVGSDADEATLRRHLCPLWIVLAGGRGTRIDRTGRLNKNLDIWFGSANTLQLSVRHLVGDVPPVVVINPDTARRLLRQDADADAADMPGLLADDLVDPEARALYIADRCSLSVQTVANGTGGALVAAREAMERSDAEIVAVAFGDEPFIDASLPAETWASHIIAGADATLCGKRPDAVVDKGGLFFGDDGRLMCTKEWYDMTPDEQERMRAALVDREAITNTGFSLFRREAVLERLDRLWLHKDGTELHHVDLFKLFHDDGLKTHAHVYEGEIRSGVNRWTNVLDGEAYLYERTRQRLAMAGLRVHSDARITLDEDIETFVARGAIAGGTLLSGRVHIGRGVTVGPYCVLENATVTGDSDVGARTRLTDTRAHNIRIAASDCEPPIAAPIRELATMTELKSCEVNDLVVGQGVHASNMRATGTLLPPNWRVEHATLGLRRDPSLGMPHTGTPTLWEFVPEDYRPGAYTFGDMRGAPDWERLREHVQRMMREQIAPRATLCESVRAMLLEGVDDLLAAQFGGEYVTDAMTPEELWGVLYELTGAITGSLDPYMADKRRDRALAAELADDLDVGSRDWPDLLRLDVAANLIDLTSVRMLERMREHPNFLAEALAQAGSVSPAIHSTARFLERLAEGDRRRILWLTDNDGETVFDLHVVRRLLDEGHTVTVAGKSAAASNDATRDDLVATARDVGLDIVAEPRLSVIASGSATVGTNLFWSTPEFVHALRESEIVVSKGQGNWYTTQGLRKDTFYLLMSKGMTAEKTTGVVAPRETPMDGLIVAYVPHDSRWTGTLREFAVT